MLIFHSLNRFFGYFSLHLFGYFGLVSSLFVSSASVCFTAVQLDGNAIETYDWKYILLRESLLISGEMGKKLLAANPTNSVLPSSFYIECSIASEGQVEIS